MAWDCHDHGHDYAMGICEVCGASEDAAVVDYTGMTDHISEMSPGKKARLEAAGWRIGTTEEFLDDVFPRQPDPVPNAEPAVWDLVMADMAARDAQGVRTYGTRLQPHNGRDALRDAYDELLDGAVYLRQAIFERDGK